jgi:hypothetical protein
MGSSCSRTFMLLTTVFILSILYECMSKETYINGYGILAWIIVHLGRTMSHEWLWWLVREHLLSIVWVHCASFLLKWSQNIRHSWTSSVYGPELCLWQHLVIVSLSHEDISIWDVHGGEVQESNLKDRTIIL